MRNQERVKSDRVSSAKLLNTNMTKLNIDMAMECSLNRPVYLLYRPQTRTLSLFIPVEASLV